MSGPLSRHAAAVRQAARGIAVGGGGEDGEGGGSGKAVGHGAFSGVGSGRTSHADARRRPLRVAWACRLLPLPCASA
ncbi:MAG: hypothetical protein J5X22_13070 [Candidatus Accumulibacter sp.]|uniref:hypothetical protein n=1 Tax=Accumulibacter sp. TaxID=2053492 RepID=UPI001ACCA5CB|nr:hypothetical protein [Accumulibacter sp.]MBN8519884.1 hypothetical protein [Accumulibacter sp.]MBO3711404.1 hypothetical protein [Accumulibacter sp.]